MWHGTRRHEGTRRGGRIGRAHQRLPDEGGVQPDRPPADERPGLADARFAHHQPVVRHQPSQSQAQLGVDFEGPQVAVVDPDQASVRGDRSFDLALVVGFHERLEPEFTGQVHEPGQPLAGQDGGDEQYEIRPGRAQDR